MSTSSSPSAARRGTVADSAITYRQLSAILRARRPTILAVLAATLALVTLLSVALPKRYTASAAVLVDGRSKDPLDGSTVLNLSIPGYLSTQTGIIKSELVSRAVIADLKLDRLPVHLEDWQSETGGQGDFTSWLSARLVKKLDVKPARDSSIIEISYTHKNPQMAADIVNAYISHYMQTTRALQVDPARATNTFFDQHTQQARDDLQTAQHALSSFQRAHGLLSTDEHLDTENARLAELTTLVVQLEASSRESANRSATAGQQRDKLGDVQGNPVLTALNNQLTQKQSDLEILRTRLGPGCRN